MNNRRTPARSSQARTPSHFIDPLEPRQLMTAFVSVGLEFDATNPTISAAAYAVEGDISAANVATGDMYFATTTGRQKVAGLPYSSLVKLADSRYQRAPSKGYRGTPSTANGAQFLTADGNSAGWWFGSYGTNSSDMEFIVERSTNSTLADLAGTWNFSIITANENTDHYTNASGSLNISGSSIQWTVNAGDIAYTAGNITSTSTNGTFITGNTEYLYLSADKKTLLMVDMSRADGISYVGVATRLDTSVTFDAIKGKGYLLSWLWSQNNGDSYAANATARQTFLELQSDGDYRIYDLDQWDDGVRDQPIEKGFWSVASGILTLDQDKSDSFTKFALSNHGANILTITSGVAPDATAGLGTLSSAVQIPTSPQHYLSVSATDANGRPVVFELGTDNVWRSTDLLTKPGGPQLLATPVSWIDQKDFKQYAAGISSIGLILYTQAYDGTWSYRNLTTEINGAEIITSALQVMAGPDKNVTITGLSATGQVLRYYQDATKLANNVDYRFLASNISMVDLTPQGLTTPTFVGKLASYATSWGGLNIAGLDSGGDIWSVWWAPGMANWTVSNLTQITGASKLSGALTVYLTSWSGINIAGLDANSQLQVAWWVPSFGGQWQQSNLSTDTAGGTGTKFRQSSVSSYVSSWGGLNIAGIDDTTGETRVFWWSPERVSLGWAISSLSTAIPAGSPVITRDTTGQVGLDNSLNVFGYNSTGQFIRYSWVPSGSWTATNLTTTATPR